MRSPIFVTPAQEKVLQVSIQQFVTSTLELLLSMAIRALLPRRATESMNSAGSFANTSFPFQIKMYISSRILNVGIWN